MTSAEWDRSWKDAVTGSVVEVEVADSVSLAREKLKTQVFEILVVDLKIAGSSGEAMGGLELISQSLSLDPLRAVIVITGYGTVELARRTLTEGVFDFIEKSTTAVDELIKAVRRAVDSRDDRIVRSGNPFTPMTGLEPVVFGGRSKELQFLHQTLNRVLHTRFCEHFLLLGNWGIGKSTLLKEYKKICQSHGHMACIVPLEPLQSGTRLAEAARSVVEAILRDLPYPLDKLNKLANFFDSVGISVFGTGLQISRDTSKKELPAQAFLHDTFIKLWDDLESKSGVLIILLDDLDNFNAVPEFLMTLKQTLSMDSMKNAKILLGIASTPTTWLNLTSIKKHHPLARYFMSRIELDPLSEGEVHDTISKSLAVTGVSFSSEVVSRVFEYTGGHPFEMQVLCYHLFNSQLSRRVGIDMWDKALQEAINTMGNAMFEHWFGQASMDEAKVLRLIAQAGAPVGAQQIRKLAASARIEVSRGNIPKYLQRLTEKKLVAKTGRSLYTVPDRMFRAYISSRAG